MSYFSITRPLIAAALLLATAQIASAAVTVTQTATIPTYPGTLNFDEVGGPTSANSTITSTSFVPSKGITFITGDGTYNVGPSGYTWLGTGNSFLGNYGVEMLFGYQVTAVSLNVWDPSGKPTFFGGGMVASINQGRSATGTNLFGQVYTPAWAGAGISGFNIVASAGTSFNDVLFYGNGDFPTTYVDNISWQVVPEPTGTSLAAIGLTGMVLRRKR